MSICGYCMDATTSLLARIRAKACCWTCLCTYVLSPIFTPLYQRRWTCRPTLKLEWNLLPAFLIIEDDQIIMKLTHSCFTNSLSASFSTTINIVNVFIACFSCLYFLLFSWMCSTTSLSIAFCHIIFKCFSNVTTWF